MTSSLPPPVVSTGPIRTLGALDRSGVLSLATLDDEPAPAPASDGMLPASMGPAAPRPARPARTRSEPLDPFAPPELATQEPLLQLADDDPAFRASKRTSTPPAVAGQPAQRLVPSQPPAGPVQPPVESARWPQPPAGPPQSPAGGSQRSGPSQPPVESARWSSQPVDASPPPAGGSQRPGPSQPPVESARSAPGTTGGPLPGELSAASPTGEISPRSAEAAQSGGAIAAAHVGLAGALATRIPALAAPRARFAVGVALAIALGFIPAHLAAGMRERSAFGAIDTKIAAVQATADTPDSYAALDAFRAEQLDAKYSARRAIVVTSLLIWAAAGGALAYAWFRGLPWQRGG